MTPFAGEHRVLTCVMPRGVGLPLLRRLADELGVATADLHSARGLSGSDTAGVFNRVEKDVLTVTVPVEQAEALFLWLYHQGEVGGQPGRFLYMARLLGATPFRVPEEVSPERG